MPAGLTPAAARPPGVLARLRASFSDSFGAVVFGMEDGTVSIFGLVAGLAATASTGPQVLMAGATGAIAAAVSMAAGVFLDNQSERDQARVTEQARRAALARDPSGIVAEVLEAAQAAGLSGSVQAALATELARHPGRALALQKALSDSGAGNAQHSLLARSAWMFVADLLAGLTPVLPFAILPFAEARIASVALTLTLLVLLGVARARVGQRAVLPTVLQTVGIAGAAALAGVAVARLLE